ncbi:unnamed protein product [Albugo candida]|uniref:Uncharacterized protein n=1 Tax=Albugo candida TaxID=65357 RepID=A0A024GL60_9STRA|nr:unnamed protein product [Albugo candida]|eukprot:CCI47627.1 unnamed protein product [Albugo candida]
MNIVRRSFFVAHSNRLEISSSKSFVGSAARLIETIRFATAVGPKSAPNRFHSGRTFFVFVCLQNHFKFVKVLGRTSKDASMLSNGSNLYKQSLYCACIFILVP